MSEPFRPVRSGDDPADARGHRKAGAGRDRVDDKIDHLARSVANATAAASCDASNLGMMVIATG